MANRDELRRRMAAMSDEGLLNVVGAQRHTYIPEAIEVAEAELAVRTVDPTQPQAFETPLEEGEWGEDQLEGTGGWLGILVGSSLVFPAIYALYFAWMSVVALRGGLLTLAVVFLAYAAFMAAAFYWLGLGLHFRWPQAVQASITVLGLTAILGVVNGLFLEDLTRATLGIIVPVAWIIYLRRSRRVYNTYPGWRQHIEESGGPSLRARWSADEEDSRQGGSVDGL